MDKGLGLAVQRAAEVVARSRYVTCLVGAGLSAESGIPTYRGPGGLWTRYGEPPLNDFQRFLADPAAYWRERLNPPTEGPRAELHRALERARPNPGHYALAELEREGVLRFTITQNIDGLEREAGCRNLVEIHGNRRWLRCLRCGARFPREGFDLRRIPPNCPRCGGLVKGDGVMFGEPIPSEWLETCYREAGRSDCMLLVGTSATVYPAASFPQMVRGRGGALVEFNPHETALTPACDVVVRAPAGQALPLLVEQVRALCKKRKSTGVSNGTTDE